MLRSFKIVVLVIAALGCASPAQAVLRFSNSFYSFRNRERDVRRSTTLIILHTTETTSPAALNKLRDNGECHYYVAQDGLVYRIIDHRRVAFHSGRSMWEGRTNVDNFSVGIEISGFHNRPLTAAQYRAVAELVGELKYIYKIPDHRVLSHCHVAYGAPNKWHRRSHRGRKRCGMNLTSPAIRKILNLHSRPLYDPDVRAGRLVVGDAHLEQTLYGTLAQSQQAAAVFSAPDSNVIARNRSAWDIARDLYNSPTTTYVFPGGTRKQGNQISDFRLLPAGTRVIVSSLADNPDESYQIIGQHGQAQDIAGAEVLSPSTLYVFQDGSYKQGHQLTAAQLVALPYGTKVLVGYAVGGPISPSRVASQICGSRWRSKDTFFLISGTLVPGDEVDDKKIPAGSMIFYKQ
jgi:N-acetylmuramoyl-L-alanine amidase